MYFYGRKKLTKVFRRDLRFLLFRVIGKRRNCKLWRKILSLSWNKSITTKASTRCLSTASHLPISLIQTQNFFCMSDSSSMPLKIVQFNFYWLLFHCFAFSFLQYTGHVILSVVNQIKTLKYCPLANANAKISH